MGRMSTYAFGRPDILMQMVRLKHNMMQMLFGEEELESAIQSGGSFALERGTYFFV